MEEEGYQKMKKIKYSWVRILGLFLVYGIMSCSGTNAQLIGNPSGGTSQEVMVAQTPTRTTPSSPQETPPTGASEDSKGERQPQIKVPPAQPAGPSPVPPLPSPLPSRPSQPFTPPPRFSYRPGYDRHSCETLHRIKGSRGCL